MIMKLYKGKLSFNKSEFNSTAGMRGAGINLPYNPERNYKDEYKVGDLELGSIFGSINESKFYDGITAQDVIPKPEDFIETPFRLLSATTVGAGTWKATDFSDEKVLRKSMERLAGKPLYKDHETDLDNWVGIVRSVKWDKAKKQGGVNIPAGINGLVAIDAKTNPKIARGVLLGSIFSNSVTVDFAWEMSHNFESEDEFLMRIGTMGDDGKMVRRIVREIHDYYESSLVWLGADPFAKAMDENGEFTNLDDTSAYSYVKQSFAKDLSSYGDEPDNVKDKALKQRNLEINCGLNKNIIPLSKGKVTQTTNKHEEMNKLTAFFIATFGSELGLKESDSLKEEDFIENLKKLSFMDSKDKSKLAAATKIEELAKETLGEDYKGLEEFSESHKFVAKETYTELTKAKDEAQRLKTEKEELEQTNESLSKDAEIGKKYSSRKKEEAKRLYKASMGNDAEDAVLTLFDKASNDEVEGLLKQYTKGATDRFSGSCSDCGSSNFKFQSSFTSDDDEVNTSEGIVTTSSLREKFGASSIKISRN